MSTKGQKVMPEEATLRDYEIDDLVMVLKIFDQLNDDSRQKLIQMVSTHIGVVGPPLNDTMPRPGASNSSTSYRPSFSVDRSMSVKEFLLEKQPRTEVQRVACLGYYLTHYRDQPNFGSLEISKLNTEAAQAKLSNPSRTIDHAMKTGYLVAAPVRGQKQLSAAAERFVESLPDYAAAKAAMTSFRSRQKRKKHSAVKTESELQ